MARACMPDHNWTWALRRFPLDLDSCHRLVGETVLESLLELAVLAVPLELPQALRSLKFKPSPPPN